MVKNKYLHRRGFKMGHFWQSFVLDLLENFVREPRSHCSLILSRIWALDREECDVGSLTKLSRRSRTKYCQK